MALIYNSEQLPSTYYLAFEDWEGANTNAYPSLQCAALASALAVLLRRQRRDESTR